MKKFTGIFLLFFHIASFSQPAQNVFIITLDGVRWQEIFSGAEESMLHNPQMVKDTSIMLQQYGGKTAEERRKTLLPFFWKVLANDGQIMGNRDFDNNVNVSNLYKISYPGYSEIFTGYADKIFIPNLAINNPRTNILQYLNHLPEYTNAVAAFCSWPVFPFILNEKSNHMPVNAGYEPVEVTDSFSMTINRIQQRMNEVNSTRHDMLTYECARNYIDQNHPRVMYVGFGESDEFAHKGEYDSYLQKIHQADAMIAELWYYVQTDQFYKNNTTFIITTDHGRGKKQSNWNTHGFWIKGSGETWMAFLGAGIPALGEVKEKNQVYQKQIAATIASLLGEHFEARHRVAQPISGLISKPANNKGTDIAISR